MSKKLRDGLVLLSVFLLLLRWSQFSVYFEPESDADKAIRKYRLVKLGMAQQAVVEMLGKPNDSDLGDLGTWRGERCSLWIHYDNNGFVVERFVNDYREPKPHQAVIDWARELRKKIS